MKLPIVLLPGLMCDRRLFQPQFDLFSQERPVLFAPTFGFETISEIASMIHQAVSHKNVFDKIS